MQPHKSHEFLTEGGCLQTGRQVNVTMEQDNTSMNDMSTTKEYLQSAEAGMIIYYGIQKECITVLTWTLGADIKLVVCRTGGHLLLEYKVQNVLHH